MSSNARNLSKLLGTSTKVPVTALPTTIENLSNKADSSGILTVNALPSVIANLETVGEKLSGGEISPSSIKSNTLTQSFDSNQTVSFTMTDSIDAISPIVSVFKEIAQGGISTKGKWDVNSTGSNYDQVDIIDLAFGSEELQFSVDNADSDGSYSLVSTSTSKNYAIASAGTITYTENTLATGNEYHSPTAKPDGTKIYTTENATGSVKITEFTLSTGWDLSTVSLTYQAAIEINPSGSAVRPRYSLTFKPDGSILYIGSNNRWIVSVPLSTPWDLSTISTVASEQSEYELPTLNSTSYYRNTTPTNSTAGIVRSLWWNSTGSKLTVGLGSGVFEVYHLSTPWDLSTLQYVTETGFGEGSGSDPNTPQLWAAISTLSSDGRHFIAGYSGWAYSFRLSVPYDILSPVFCIGLHTGLGSSEGYVASSDGSKLIFDRSGGLRETSMVGQWDINLDGCIGWKVEANGGSAIIKSARRRNESDNTYQIYRTNQYFNTSSFFNTNPTTSFTLKPLDVTSNGFTPVKKVETGWPMIHRMGRYTNNSGQGGGYTNTRAAYSGYRAGDQTARVIGWDPTGYKLYVNDRYNLYQYTVANPYDTSVAPSSTVSLQWDNLGVMSSNERSNTTSFIKGIFSPDGLYFSTLRFPKEADIMTYPGPYSLVTSTATLSTAWDISTMGSASTYIQTNLQQTSGNNGMEPKSMQWSADGNSLWAWIDEYDNGFNQIELLKFPTPAAYKLVHSGSGLSNYTARNTNFGGDGRYEIINNYHTVLSSFDREMKFKTFSVAEDFTGSPVTEANGEENNLRYFINNNTNQGYYDWALTQDKKMFTGLGQTYLATGHVYDTYTGTKRIPQVAITNSTLGQITTSEWSDIQGMTADEIATTKTDIYYAFSTDERNSFKIVHPSDGLRTIAKNNSGTWQINAAASFGSETWVDMGTDVYTALSAALRLTQNRLTKTLLDSVSDENQISTSDKFDLMIAFNYNEELSSIANIPDENLGSTDAITINYAAEALVREAVPGTDYIAEFPNPTTLNITSINPANLKIRAQ